MESKLFEWFLYHTYFHWNVVLNKLLFLFIALIIKIPPVELLQALGKLYIGTNPVTEQS